MGQIKFLSEQTINQIAAGEVIENPASVIKELLVNGIDAKSSHITVEIIGGGFGLIRISDNGVGMCEEDALLSLQRHATSKLFSISDFSSLQTMGFRGEALASIAAISDMTLTTATANSTGVRLHMEGGELKSVSPYPRTKGTTIEIRALFYNVPARKKFQKSSSASTAEIHKQILLLSLIHKEISFKFINQDACIFDLSSQTAMLDRIHDALGKEFLAEPLFFEKAVGPYKMEAFLGSAGLARQNRSGQYLFVNQRPIHSLPLSFAVKEGYGTRIDRDRHPVFILHLQLPPQLVDVNVHPQKREVRFQEESLLKNMIRESVQESFQESPVFLSTFSFDLPLRVEPDWPSSSLLLRETPLKEEPSFFAEDISLQVMGLWENYLFLHEPSNLGLTIIDLSAVEEKLAFENLQNNSLKAVQGLLIPLLVPLSDLEIPQLESKRKELEALGFSIEWMGKSTLGVSAIPSCLKEEFVVDAIHRLIEGVESPLRLMASYVRAQKKKFMLQEAIDLVKKIKAYPGPLKTPRGEPIEVVWEKNKIDKLFRV